MIDVPGDHILVLPAKLMTQTTNSAVLAARLQPQNTQSLGNHNSLLLVIRRRNTLEGLESLHGGGAARSLVGDHATDRSPEHLGGSAEMEGT